MSRFQDYLSSAITPQMTLLEKFNAFIKFLKENNYISIFYSSENYNPNTRDYQISNVSTLNYKLHLGDCIVFSNGYYAFVETLGENTFTIGNILYFQGKQGVSIVSANINNTGNLILTLSDGNTINAGNIGAVRDFIIDENQHLIVRYLNGTQNDLGNIFNGNVNINGTLNATKVTGDEIVENMSGYSYSRTDTSNVTYDISYCGVVKTGNKITFAIVGAVTRTGATAVIDLGKFSIPTVVGSKLFPMNSNWLRMDNAYLADNYNSGVNTPCLCYKENNDSIGFQLYKVNDNLVENTKYYFRQEVTFLLSNSLI